MGTNLKDISTHLNPISPDFRDKVSHQWRFPPSSPVPSSPASALGPHRRLLRPLAFAVARARASSSALSGVKVGATFPSSQGPHQGRLTRALVEAPAVGAGHGKPTSSRSRRRSRIFQRCLWRRLLLLRRLQERFLPSPLVCASASLTNFLLGWFNICLILVRNLAFFRSTLYDLSLKMMLLQKSFLRFMHFLFFFKWGTYLCFKCWNKRENLSLPFRLCLSWLIKYQSLFYLIVIRGSRMIISVMVHVPYSFWALFRLDIW